MLVVHRAQRLGPYTWQMPRQWPGYDDPVNIDAEPEDALRTLLADDVDESEPEDTE